MNSGYAAITSRSRVDTSIMENTSFPNEISCVVCVMQLYVQVKRLTLV